MNLFASAFSTQPDLAAAVEDCALQLRASMGGARVDLLTCFLSHSYSDRFAELQDLLRAQIAAAHVIGCAGESVIGVGQEVEHGPALSLLAAHLPEVRIDSFCLQVEFDRDHEGERQLRIHGMPDLPVYGDDFIAAGDRESDSPPLMIFLGEPYTFPVPEWLEGVNQKLPQLQVFGGMASGGLGPAANRLFCDGKSLHEGAVGVVLHGARVRTVVSQGCRPIGPSMVITRSHENVVEELAGKPPLSQLQSILDDCDDEQREVLRQALQSGGLHLGQVIDERLSDPQRGDFLVKSVLGTDPTKGLIMIGDYARRGRTVRFHLRDAECADDDLKQLLGSVGGEESLAGAMVFSCNGRGTRLFGKPSHDASCVEAQFGALPIAGFFAQGELGPVGGRNFIHGFTCAVLLFEK